MDRWEWAWSGDWGRARMIDEALSSQASYFGSQTAQLSNKLSTLSKDVSQRLDVLTRAFVAYVQLDGVRQELTGFADHARARREARAAVDALVEGHQPAVIEDVPGYWLVPAVNAVRPDGSIDAALLAEAISRDQRSATRFVLALRTRLGVGPQCLDELVSVLSRHDDSQDWDAVQMMLWAAVLRGAFGPAALQSLAPIAQQAFATMDTAAWGQWLAMAALEHPATKGHRLGRIEGRQVVEWVGDRLSEVMEPVDGAISEDHWQGTWAAPPILRDEPTVPGPGNEVPAGGVAASGAGSGAVPASLASDETPAKNAFPASDGGRMSADDSTRAMLLRVVDHLVTRGAEGEQELLRHAEQLRAEVVVPLGLEDQVSLVDELPLSAGNVVDAIGLAGFDSNAALVDRRTILEWMGPHLREWAQALADVPQEEAAQVRVVGHSELVATAGGVGDRAAVERVMRELGITAGETGSRSVLSIALGAGTGVLGTAGLIMLLMEQHQGVGLLLLVMGLGCVLGFAKISFTRRASEGLREQRRESLERSMDTATRRAEEADAKNAAAHQAMQAATQRLQALIPESGDR